MTVMGLTPLYFPLTLYKLTYIKLSEALCELAPCFNNYWSKLWAYLLKKKQTRLALRTLTRAEKLQEVLDSVHLPLAACELEGGGALVVALTGVRCLLYQQLDHFQVTLLGGQV